LVNVQHDFLDFVDVVRVLPKFLLLTQVVVDDQVLLTHALLVGDFDEHVFEVEAALQEVCFDVLLV